MRTPVLCTLFAAAFGTAVVAFAADHGEHHGQAPATAPTTQQAAPVNKYCPIEKENAITPGVTTVYEGKTVGFCCADCIPEFKKDPAKYMKDLK